MARKNPAAVALGRLGGKVVTEKKREHLRRASKQPRPGARKFAAGDRVRVKDGAPMAYRGQLGQIVESRERARYEVQLEDGTTVPLYSWWLETIR